MKKFEFKHQQKRWDSYNCFHATEGPFVEFETGEVILTGGRLDPHTRRTWNRYDIQLVATADSDCPQLYLDKKCTEPVKTAWVTQGGHQVLAVDLEQRVAVKVNSHWGKKTQHLQFLGSHLQNAAAVWTGPERLPIPLAKITVSQPDRNMVKELTPKLEEVRTAVRAAARIQGVERHYWDGGRLGVKREWMGMTVEDICAYVCADKILMRTVAFNGFTHPRAETQHDFLYIK